MRSFSSIKSIKVEQIRRRRAFDDEFYISSYRGEIPEGMDALEHFLRIGQARGFKPNASFDPLLYRIRFPEADAANPLTHALQRFDNLPEFNIGGMFAGIERRPQGRWFYVKPLPGILPGNTLNAEVERAAAEAGRHDQPGETIFSADGRDYCLRSPSAEWFIRRFEQDRPFAFSRLSHGDWECLYLLEHYRREITARLAERGFIGEQCLMLAARLCNEWHYDQMMFAENFIPELFRDLEAKPHAESFIHAIAFNGCPTSDGRLLRWTENVRECDEAFLQFVAQFFDPEEPLIDATVLKRWMITGELAVLPSIARQRPVVLLGPDRLGSIGSRWKLPWLLKVSMPHEHSYALRYELLERCCERVDEAISIAEENNTGRPLFLTQGSSLAYWFIRRLSEAHPDVFYLDMGQALHSWFYDSEDFPVMPWDRYFAPVIIRSCGLESYYRELGLEVSGHRFALVKAS